MKVDLTIEEVLALHELGAYSLHSSRVDISDPDVAPLVSAVRKLREAGGEKFCRHCRERVSRRKDRICDPCNTYRSKYGELPPERVLERRAS